MHNAAFPRRHRIQPKGLLGSLYALGGHARGHAQLLKAKRAITAAIDVKFLVVLRLKPQSAEGQMLQGFQNFGIVLEQNFLIASVDVGKHFGIAAFARFDDLHVDLQLKAGDAHNVFEKVSQRVSGRLAIELSVVHQFLGHGAFNKKSIP